MKQLAFSLIIASAPTGLFAQGFSALIKAARMNNVDLEDWLMWILECLPEHKIDQVSELMPWIRHAKANDTQKL